MQGQRGFGICSQQLYFGRGHTLLLERERINQKTIENRRLHHRKAAA